MMVHLRLFSSEVHKCKCYRLQCAKYGCFGAVCMYERSDFKVMGFLDFLFKKDEEEEIKKKKSLPIQPLKKLVDFLPNKLAPVEPPAPLSSYKVQPGDSLWDITERVNGAPATWPKLYEKNKQIIGNNPDLIFPKQNLDLTPILPRISPGPRRDLLPIKPPRQQITEDPIPLSRINKINPLPIDGGATISQHNPSLLERIGSVISDIKSGVLPGAGESILGVTGDKLLDKVWQKSYENAQEKGQLPYGIPTDEKKPFVAENFAQSAGKFIGQNIGDLPAWLAGDALLAKPLGALAKSKTLQKAADATPQLLRPLARTITPALGTGARVGATYGGVIAPLESALHGDSLSQFLDREKQVPLMAAGGVVLHGAGQLIGKGAKEATNALSERKISKLISPLQTNPLKDVQSAYKSPLLQDFNTNELQKNSVKYNLGADRTPEPIKPLPLKQLSTKQGELQRTFNDLPNQGRYSFTTGEQRAMSELQDGIRTAQNYVGHTDVLAGYPPGTTIEQAYADVAKNTGVDLPKLVSNWEKAQTAKTSLTPKELSIGRTAGVIPELAQRKLLTPRETIEPPLSKPLPLKSPEKLTWSNRDNIPLRSPNPMLPIQSLGQLPKGQLNTPLKTPTGKLSSPIIEPTSDVRILGQDGNLDFAIPQGPIKPMSAAPAPIQTLEQSNILRGPLKPLPVTEPVGTKRLSFPDTVARGEITNPELATRLEQAELNYGNITNKDTLEVARKYIETNRDDALHLVMSDAAPTAESNAVAQLLIKEANDLGRFDQAISIIEKTATKAKTQGQAIQALSMWGRLSPEGVLKYAENTMTKSRTIKQVAELDNATKNLTDAMGRVNSQVAENVLKEVESGLGPKLSNKPVRQVSKAPKLSDDIIKKLDAIELASRERLASRRGSLNSLPVDILGEYALIGTVRIAKGAVKFSAWSAEMLKEFGDDIKPHLSKIWDQSQRGYDDFAKSNGIAIVEAELTQVNRSVGQGLRDMNVNIGDIVRQHYSVGNKVQTDLVTQLVEKAGLSGEDAVILEKYVLNRMKELTQSKKEQILNQMFKPRLAPKQKEISQKIIELSNLGGLQEQKYKALVGEKLGIPSLDEVTAKTIYEQSNRIQKMADGREKEVAIAQMLDTVASKIPPTMLQKIATLQTMAQLLNPKTAIRNIVGNAGFAGMENVSNTLGAGIDKGVSLITKQRTRTLPSISTQLKGGREGFKLGLEDAMKGISTSSTKTQFDLSPTKTFRSGPLGKLETAMNIELRASDRAFYQAAYDDSLRGQMKLAKVTEPTEAMKEIADHDGLYKTFQDTNVLSTAFSSLKKLLNDPIHLAGKANHREPIAFGLGDLVIKYPKTPGNLLARGIDYSPAGFVKVVMEASKPLMGKEFNQRAFVDAFSRAIVGTGSLVGTGALLHRVGILSSKRNSDYDVAALERQVGLGEYKVNVSALKRFVLNGLDPASSSELKKGDTLVSWDWFQPQALPIAMGADIDANGSSPKGFIGTLTSSLATGLDTFADQPITQGIKTLVGGGDLSDGLSNVLQGVPASFVPTLLNQVKQLLDNQKRNTYSPNWIEKTTNLVVGKIPMIEKRLQPTYDALGNKVQTYQDGSNNPLNVFLNPAFVSQYSPSKEAELALNAYKQTGETKQIPTIIPKYFTVTGQRFDLTSEEYATMQRIVGERTKKEFGSISSGSNTAKQIGQMTQAIEKARLEGKKAILNGRGVRYVQSGNTLKIK